MRSKKNIFLLKGKTEILTLSHLRANNPFKATVVERYLSVFLYIINAVYDIQDHCSSSSGLLSILIFIFKQLRFDLYCFKLSL